MKRFIFYIICCISWGVVFAQQDKHYSIPDFAKIPSEQIHDSMQKWYDINLSYSKAANSEKLRLMNGLKEYGEQSNDVVIKVSTMFFWGHFEVMQGKGKEAVDHIIKARDMAKKHGLKYQWAVFSHLLSCYETNTAKRLEYLISLRDELEHDGLTETRIYWAVRNDLGNIMYQLRNYRRCLEELLPVLEMLEKENDRTSLWAWLNNTIGLAYREMGQNDSALFHFNKMLEVSTKDEGTLATLTGIATGNIASVYLKEHRLDSALVYGRLYYDLVKKSPHLPGAELAGAILVLSTIYIEQHKPDTVLPMLLEAERLLNGKQIAGTPNADRIMQDVCYMLAEAFRRKGQNVQARQYAEKALTLQKETSKRNNTETYLKVKEQLEAEKNISQMKDAENAIRISVQRRNFSIATLCLAALIIFSLYRRQQVRNKKDKAIFDSREQLLYTEKKQAEENLASFMKNLQEKNNLIEHLEREIAMMGEESKDQGHDKIYDTLNRLKRSTIITNDDWTDFKVLFEKAYRNFFSNLKQKFPDITPAEMRMMALMKLDIPTRKMADMLGISSESIRKTQYRFVKKINSSGVSDLVKIVNSL